jgi:hypothetical protein
MGLLESARNSRFLGGLSRSGTEANELQKATQEVGATPINRCQRGEIVTACGVLNTVTMRPRAGVPAVEADLYDGTGHLTIVWLGRRHISGIEAGRALSITGRMTCDGDLTTIFNPRYQLRPRGNS